MNHTQLTTRAAPTAQTAEATRLLAARQTCSCGHPSRLSGLCTTCQQQRLTGRLQAKLSISQPGDVYEAEADRTAEAVMRMPASSLAGAVQRQAASEQAEEPDELVQAKFEPDHIQRQAEPEEEEEEPIQAKFEPDRIQRQAEPEAEEEQEEETVQTKPAGLARPSPGPQRVQSIPALGTGQTLNPETRAFMEPRFGYDFSKVRVHTDPQAADLAQRLQARAFTRGRDIVFAAGQYAPATQAGKQLLAHELTHTIQQNAGPTPELPRKPDAGYSSERSSGAGQ